ncbi:MAG: pyridoxamine 5'-phosphate oxidase family protein [Roseiarcus sp.]|jgi:pyridoxamine 5'-phosphate oxidase-like protein
MAEFFPALTPKLTAFIEAQPMFFIASAAAEGRINLSPKGLDTFRVVAPDLCVYLDITGSGNETAAHARAGGRATIMFCSFSRNPLVLRLFGRTRTGARGSALWDTFSSRFETYPGARQIVAIDVESAQTACGFGVPEMSLVRPRPTMSEYWRAKGEDGAAAYRDANNRASIDGLPTGWGEG